MFPYHNPLIANNLRVADGFFPTLPKKKGGRAEKNPTTQMVRGYGAGIGNNLSQFLGTLVFRVLGQKNIVFPVSTHHSQLVPPRVVHLYINHHNHCILVDQNVGSQCPLFLLSQEQLYPPNFLTTITCQVPATH